MKDILRTNTLENSVDYLEKAVFYFNNREDAYWFKWLMISLHGALYGFGVCTIKGTTSERVLKMKLGKKKYEQGKEEIIQHYKNSGFEVDGDILDDTVWYHLSELLNIWDILDCCQSESYMIQFSFSKVLCLTDRQKEALNRVINYRNHFAHFKPADVSVILESEKWIIKEVVDVIKFLAFESGNVNYFGEENRKKVIEHLEKFNN